MSPRTTPAGAATGPDTDTVLQTEGVTKEFGGLTAVDDVDFGVDTGELHCLIGPNGAGKSTLLGLITGQLQPTAGRVFYQGREITELEPFERVREGISLKFQSPNLFGALSVRENLRVPLQRTSEGDSTRRASALLEKVGLTAELLADRASQLSHGQQQRLEVAMALATDPDLLLLDEPVAGLSVEERTRVAELLRSLNADGLTFVVVEHDIDFVEQVADTVTVLHQGECFRQGSIEAIRDDDEVRRIYLGGT